MTPLTWLGIRLSGGTPLEHKVTPPQQRWGGVKGFTLDMWAYHTLTSLGYVTHPCDTLHMVWNSPKWWDPA